MGFGLDLFHKGQKTVTSIFTELLFGEEADCDGNNFHDWRYISWDYEAKTLMNYSSTLMVADKVAMMQILGRTLVLNVSALMNNRLLGTWWQNLGSRLRILIKIHSSDLLTKLEGYKNFHSKYILCHRISYARELLIRPGTLAQQSKKNFGCLSQPTP